MKKRDVWTYESFVRPGAFRAGEDSERLRIRRALLAVGVIREGKWVYRESVIAAIKKATRAPARKGRR